MPARTFVGRGMSGRPPRVGLFLRGGSYAYQDEIVIGAHQECSAHGVNPTVCRGATSRCPIRGTSFTRCRSGGPGCGGVRQGHDGRRRRRQGRGAMLERLGPLPACTIGSPEPGLPCVAINNSSGVRALTRHLIEKHDCKRIAFLTGHGREAEQRLAGYRAGHRDAGVSPAEELLIRGDFEFGAGQDAVAKLFESGGSCDAIVAANDWMALGALEALRARGLRVPEDVAVVGFDDLDDAKFASPPLTTVRQAPRQLGIEAVRLVLARLRGETCGDVLLETLLQIRQSCGCFRGTRRGDPAPASPARGRAGPTTPPGRVPWRRAGPRRIRRCRAIGRSAWSLRFGAIWSAAGAEASLRRSTKSSAARRRSATSAPGTSRSRRWSRGDPRSGGDHGGAGARGVDLREHAHLDRRPRRARPGTPAPGDRGGVPGARGSR